MNHMDGLRPITLTQAVAIKYRYGLILPEEPCYLHSALRGVWLRGTKPVNRDRAVIVVIGEHYAPPIWQKL